MGNESKHYRKIAADHLRKARLASSPNKELDAYLARGYKFLAHDAERHDGEPEKSRTRAPEKRR
jgi:hypothetical protein